MANKHWLGGTVDHETEMTTAANWSPAAVPTTDDTIWFDGRAGDDSATGKKYDCIANGSAAVRLAGLNVMSDYDGDIALVTEPWEIHFSVTADTTEQLNFAGSGTAYIMNSGEGAVALTFIPVVICNPPSGGSLHLISEFNTNLTTFNLFTKVIQISGTLYLWGTAAAGALAVGQPGMSCCIAELFMCGGTCYSQEGVQLPPTAIAANYAGLGNNFANAVDNQATYILMKGGTLYWNSRLVDATGAGSLEHILNIFGGTFNWGQDTYSGEAALDAGLIRLFNGIFNWGTEDAVKSIIGQIEVFSGGTLQISQTHGVAGIKELGLAGGTKSIVYTGGKIDLTSAYEQFAFEDTDCVLISRGGTITVPPSEELTW